VSGSAATHDGAVYTNTRLAQTSRHHLLSHLTHRPPDQTQHPQQRQQRASGKDPTLFHDDEDGYCLPQPHSSLLKDAERGQGVGAEEDRNLSYGPLATAARSSGNPAGSCALRRQPGLPRRVGFTCLDDVPADLRELSVAEVLQCLRWLNLDAHVERFRAEHIDGELLTSVDQQLLVDEFGFKRFDAIKLEKFARNGWRPKIDRASLDQHHYYYHQQQQPYVQLQFSPNEPLYTDV